MIRPARSRRGPQPCHARRLSCPASCSEPLGGGHVTGSDSRVPAAGEGWPRMPAGRLLHRRPGTAAAGMPLVVESDPLSESPALGLPGPAAESRAARGTQMEVVVPAWADVSDCRRRLEAVVADHRARWEAQGTCWPPARASRPLSAPVVTASTRAHSPCLSSGSPPAPTRSRRLSSPPGTCTPTPSQRRYTHTASSPAHLLCRSSLPARPSTHRAPRRAAFPPATTWKRCPARNPEPQCSRSMSTVKLGDSPANLIKANS